MEDRHIYGAKITVMTPIVPALDGLQPFGTAVSLPLNLTGKLVGIGKISPHHTLLNVLPSSRNQALKAHENQ